MRCLNNEHHLKYVTTQSEALGSVVLHHCYNCDEEWPVMIMGWPQSGVAFAGPKAGVSEVMQKHGFFKCEKNANQCTRCTQRVVYRETYSNANWQHLGKRHPALSALTWYESQLVARVHAVMSVLTLQTTGQMCFAGHVCNYYQSTLEWHHAASSKSSSFWLRGVGASDYQIC